MTTLDDLVAEPPRPGPRVRADDGVELATWDLGGDGPPVLLVHATGFHAWSWLAAAAGLRAHHRVWALDQRGHGTSDPSPTRSYLDWVPFGTDVVRVVDALGLERPLGVGHSLGGATLLQAELLRPGTFSALYCFEPIVITPEWSLRSESSLAAGARRRRATFPSAQAAVDNFRHKPPLSVLAPGVVEAYVAHGFAPLPDGSVTLRLPGPEEATVYDGAPGAGIASRLGEIRVPVTVGGGDLGPADGPVSIIDHLADALPAGRAEHFPTLGHFGPMQDPPLVAAAVLAALG